VEATLVRNGGVEIGSTASLSLRERSAVSPMTGNTDSARIVWLDPSRHCSPQWIAFHLDKPRVDKH